MLLRPPRPTLFPLHDALPISADAALSLADPRRGPDAARSRLRHRPPSRHGAQRSEERRVGKECRARWLPYDVEKNKYNGIYVSFSMHNQLYSVLRLLKHQHES